MKIETKYQPGDVVWTLVDNKARELIIGSIKVEIETDKTTIMVFMNKVTVPGLDYKCHLTEEKFCFETRQELINSL
jgi:hypothetical protein